MLVHDENTYASFENDTEPVFDAGYTDYDYFYVHDGSGTVRQIVEPLESATVNSYDYEYFGSNYGGAPEEDIYNRFRYIGDEIDSETQTDLSEALYHLNGNTYDPSTGIYFQEGEKPQTHPKKRKTKRPKVPGDPKEAAKWFRERGMEDAAKECDEMAKENEKDLQWRERQAEALKKRIEEGLAAYLEEQQKEKRKKIEVDLRKHKSEWIDSDHDIGSLGNCFRYALGDKMEEGIDRGGRLSKLDDYYKEHNMQPSDWDSTKCDCEELKRAFCKHFGYNDTKTCEKKIGTTYEGSCDKKCGKNPDGSFKSCRKIFMCVGKNDDGNCDFHFYREIRKGVWFHKMGANDVSGTDASDDIIENPVNANRNYEPKGKYNYSESCGFWCVPE